MTRALSQTEVERYSRDEALLIARLGAVHARQRLGIERVTQPRVFGNGINFFHPENWYSIHSFIRNSLRLCGLYRRGNRNILDIRLHQNRLTVPRLPGAFHGYRILHLSDLHVDMDTAALEAIIERVRGLDYDLCVLTGDYRILTHGPIEAAVDGMRLLVQALKQPMYGVLGNHDSIRMLPHLEDMGIRMLLNESVYINRGSERFILAGIDDAHYFRVDNIQKAADKVNGDTASVLLSHTPEVYRQAAHAGFDLFLCGHTHGGQICLPGGIALTLDAKCPRSLGARNWQYQQMLGYTSVGAGTSVVPVRLNCLPEITIHELSVEQAVLSDPAPAVLTGPSLVSEKSADH